MGKKDKLHQMESYYTLFIKFSRRIPNPLNIKDEVLSMYSNILNVRKPRQKSARWILVDFETIEYAEEFKKILLEKKHISTLPVKVKKLNIKLSDHSKPDNERQDKLNSLARQTFESKKLEKYTNKLLVTNLSENVTMNELREWFPNHLHIEMKHAPKVRAIITYSSAKEAFDARLALKHTIAKEKFRVIILLMNSENFKRKKPVGERYFENEIE
ncbi:hypothetical protein PVAND_007371 [Polypedilum vanderplanki]|uniref:RRM domain-containing protein n=1 Tax=Polypedilum vanderplanki TaxID=319348 RepID=A0A9J6C7M1_POLVA|nr:hypothetical protein PVAND_007371 [Polypedilum vanderplanki]